MLLTTIAFTRIIVIELVNNIWAYYVLGTL